MGKRKYFSIFIFRSIMKKEEKKRKKEKKKKKKKRKKKKREKGEEPIYRGNQGGFHSKLQGQQQQQHTQNEVLSLCPHINNNLYGFFVYTHLHEFPIQNMLLYEFPIPTSKSQNFFHDFVFSCFFSRHCLRPPHVVAFLPTCVEVFFFAFF